MEAMELEYARLIKALENPIDVGRPVILPDFYIDHFVIAGQFDEFSYSTARFSLKDIKEKIYSREKDERYNQFVIDFEKNKELKEQSKNFGLGIYDG